MPTTYGQYCPIAMTSEVFTERWTPLVVRELLCGATRFNEIRRGVPLMSPSLLSKRLKTLERVGVINRRPGPAGQAAEYVLTPAGEELRPIIESMGIWGERWARADVKAHHLDASYLMWNVRRRIEIDEYPKARTVVHFHLRGSSDKKSRFWLVLEPDVVDLCLVDPGFEPDVVVECHMRTMVDYWMGRIEFADAIKSGAMTVDGPRELTRRLPTWFLRSEVVGFERP